MHLLIAAFALFLIGSSPGLAGAAETLSNAQFRIGYSTSGITSLMRVEDRYETDYIAPGRTLGDVVIRYRARGAKEWKEASAAMIEGAEPAGGSTLSYRIGAAVPTLATSSRASASVPGFGVSALNDKVVPKNSRDIGVFLFEWQRRSGTTEWAQYDFPEPQKVSSAEVFWAEQDRDSSPCRLPKSWRVLYREGEDWKEVRTTGGYPVAPDQFNKVTFEPVVTTVLRLEVQLAENATAGIFEWRVNDDPGTQVESLHDLRANGQFQLKRDAFVWTITLQNDADHELEIGDLALPLHFNTEYVWDRMETYTKRLIRHAFIGGNGSFIFWMRTNAEGPYLVMVPQKGTSIEYFDQAGLDRTYSVHIHSAVDGEENRVRGGTWRLPNTSLVLQPKGETGDSATYGFRFRWAEDYDAVREALYDEELFDVHVVPGMTIPTDLPVMFSLRTRNRIRAVVPEHPKSTEIKYLGERGKDVRVYQVRFKGLGENLIRVEYGDGEYLPLEFFVTEPLETMIKKRAAFMVSHEQHRDPSKWYHGLFSQWDMKNQILRSPDDLDGLQSYAVACDDPILGKAPYLAEKNIFYPSQGEIEALEYHIRHYVWGGLQMTDKEKRPYAIYGIPNWRVNRESEDDDQRGKDHVWRIYDYPHVILLYYNMYRLASLYPEMTQYLDKDGYLERAFGTAKAFFTVPLKVVDWSAYRTGTYNELVIPHLIEALYANGRKDQGDWLKAEWEKKVKYFINDHPYLFGSEYPFDSTGFESTHAFAKYAMTHVLKPGEVAPANLPEDDFRRQVKYADALEFLNEQMRLNLACRGWLETAYYLLGSDFRASGGASYTLSYMAQMGGWAVLDYALHYAQDPAPYLRLGYASYLSSWALLNSGTAECNYGYWYPGKNNDGGASGGFEPRPWGRAWLGNKEMGRGAWWYSGEIDLGFNGALRAAATVVVEDPIFGLFAYGGELQRKKTEIQVIPQDGVRTRFHVVRGAGRLHLLLERDGFAHQQPVTFDDKLSGIAFTLENRAGRSHETEIQIAGLPTGTYQVEVGDTVLKTLTSRDGSKARIHVPIDSALVRVTIARVR